MNKVMLIGRLTKDPDVRNTQTGKTVARFTLAVDRMKKDEADFISCQAWDKTAEFIRQYVGKCRQVGIEGHILTGSYEKDGRRIYTTDVVVDRLEPIGKRSDAQAQEAPAPAKDDEGFMDIPEQFSVDDFPFK